MTVSETSSPIHGSLDAAPFQELRSTLQGSLICPGDEQYDEASSVFNAMIDRKPAAIVQCRDTRDVVAAVGFARQHNLLLSVRGGGHGVAGHSVVDGGLVVDLSLMKDLRVDQARRVA